jgi:hypothetical protein
MGGPSDDQTTSVTGAPVQYVYVALFDLACIPYKCSIFTDSGNMWFVMWVTEGPLTFLRLVFTVLCTVLVGYQRQGKPLACYKQISLSVIQMLFDIRGSQGDDYNC